jgi:hypothetical protein
VRELLAGAEAPVPAKARDRGTVEVWSHLVVADGVEVALEPGRAGLKPEDVRRFFRGVMALYDEIAKEKDRED